MRSSGNQQDWKEVFVHTRVYTHERMQVLLNSLTRCQKSLGEGEFKTYLVLHLTAISTSTKLSPVYIGTEEERLTNVGGYLKEGKEGQRRLYRKTIVSSQLMAAVNDHQE